MSAHDPNDPGNAPRYQTGRTCIEPGCFAPAGTWWSPLWCQKHNAERLDRVSGQLADIARGFDLALRRVGHEAVGAPALGGGATNNDQPQEERAMSDIDRTRRDRACEFVNNPENAEGLGSCDRLWLANLLGHMLRENEVRVAKLRVAEKAIGAIRAEVQRHRAADFQADAVEGLRALLTEWDALAEASR